MASSQAVVSIAVNNEPSPAGSDRAELQNRRIVEAILFAAGEPVSAEALANRLPDDVDVSPILEHLRSSYADKGVNLVQIAGKWMFRTASDLSFLLSRESVAQRRLSRAALETLAIIAYHQPVTRADIEEIRGVATSKGTLDVLMESGWIRMRGRRRTPGRPITYGTTDDFLSHFGLDNVGDLPGVEELKGAGLLDSRVPANFTVPEPHDSPELRDDEGPLEDDDVFEPGV
jgi:segregation and condensation protein B